MQLLTYIARTIIWLLGWQQFNTDDIIHCTNCVSLFPHTSSWDFVMAILYISSAGSKGSNMRILVKPQLFNTYSSGLLARLGCIASAPVGSGLGATQSLIKQVSKQGYQLLISPKGMRIHSEWRTGWFHVAQGADMNIRVTGIDYKHKCIVFSRNFVIPTEYHECRTQLEQEMNSITQLYPSSMGSNDPDQTIIGFKRKTMICCIVMYVLICTYMLI